MPITFVTKSPVDPTLTPVPIHPLLTLREFVLPIPTPSTLTISSPIFIRSPPVIEVIPVSLRVSSVVNNVSASVVVTAVETMGDWIKLSIAINPLAFWFVETNLCEVPIPTLVKSTASGNGFNAFSALEAILILFSFTLIANNSPGRKVVVPTPTNEVLAIPIAMVDPAPACLYSIFSPVTKKWFGILIELVVRFMTLELLPSNDLWKIGVVSCFNSNALLMSLSVPSYVANPDSITALLKSISSLPSSWCLIAFI